MKAPASLKCAALAIAAFTVVSFIAYPGFAQNKPGFEPVSAKVSTGKNVRVELRLVGVTPPPAAADISVTSSRIDMGPDGMATMASPLKALPGTAPGILAFETEFSMAGRWALSITARVKGHAEPISGVVVFTAADRKSESPGAAPEGNRKIVYYRNPMGQPDVSPVPKKDSMGMDYIPVYEDETGGPHGSVRISPEKVQRAGVRTAPAARQTIIRSILAPGSIVADESQIAVVTAKFNGFVEELFVPVTGQEVRAGEKLMRVWIESADILQKQVDLTATYGGGKSNLVSVETAEKNLRIFGFNDQTIDEIRRAGRPLRSVTFYVPRDGTVIEKPATVGMRFESGDTLFRTVDLSSVWVIAQVSERDLASIRPGQKARVTLKAYPGDALEGRVAFVYPELKEATRTVPVRIVLPNPDGRLLPGLYADVSIESGSGKAASIAVPESSVIDSGTRRIVFVAKGEGLFEPRDVTLGMRGNGLVEIKAGIEEGEQVVVAGNFLIDAESNLKAALAGFAPADGSK